MPGRYLYILFLVVSSGAFAQTNEILPPQFNQFFKTYSLYNPASMGINSDLEINMGDKALTGVFKGVRTYYLNINYALNRHERDSTNKVIRHMAGLVFINDKEGTYFSRSRSGLNYAIHIPLSENVTLNGGASVGFVNHAFKASNLGGGGSAFTPNSDVGIWMYGKDYNIGFSINQIFAGELTPLQQTFTLPKHITIIGEKSIQIDYYFTLTPAFQIRYVHKDFYNIDLSLRGTLQDKLTVGINYKYNRGISFMGGVEKVSFGKHYINFMISYYTFFNHNVIYNPQTLEISLNLFRQKNRDND